MIRSRSARMSDSSGVKLSGVSANFFKMHRSQQGAVSPAKCEPRQDLNMSRCTNLGGWVSEISIRDLAPAVVVLRVYPIPQPAIQLLFVS